MSTFGDSEQFESPEPFFPGNSAKTGSPSFFESADQKEARLEEERARWVKIKAIMIERESENCYTPEEFETARQNGEVADLDIRIQSLNDPIDLIRYVDAPEKGMTVRYFVQVYDYYGHGVGLRFDGEGMIYPSQALRRQDLASRSGDL